MRKVLSLAAALALSLAIAAPALAHPNVPPQSVCVLPAAAAHGIHTAAGNVSGVAAHVLFVKSPHFCQ